MAKKLLFVVNEAIFFLSHRLPLAEAARRKGYDVHIATTEGTGVQKIKDMKSIVIILKNIIKCWQVDQVLKHKKALSS